MNPNRLICLIAFLLCASSAFGGGSATDAEVDAILDQEPALAGFIRSEMDFCRGSWNAEVRLAGDYSLGGKRLGPYVRRIRPMGSKGNFDFVLTVKTAYTGYDAEAREVDVTQASRIDERLESIDLRVAPCREDWCMAPQ